MKIALGLLALLLLASSCGGGTLASSDGSEEGAFDRESSSFTVTAGDELRASWAIAPEAGSGDSWLKVLLVGDDGSSEMLTLGSGYEDSGTWDWTASSDGSYSISVSGENYGWSVEVSRL